MSVLGEWCSVDSGRVNGGFRNSFPPPDPVKSAPTCEYRGGRQWKPGHDVQAESIAPTEPVGSSPVLTFARSSKLHDPGPSSRCPSETCNQDML